MAVTAHAHELPSVFILSHLHLLANGAGAAQVQTPTGTAEGFLHLTRALHSRTRFQETLNAFSSLGFFLSF